MSGNEVTGATKWCATCNGGDGAFQTLDKFWKNKARHDNLQAHCIVCQKKHDRDNPEQRRRRRKKWTKKSRPLEGFKVGKAKEAVEDFIAGKEVELPGDEEAALILKAFLEGDIQRIGE